MKYSIEQVLTFVHVVEGGSFTAAANRLEMSKAIVSQRIKALEAYLDVQLLMRTTRKLTLTDAGHDFYEQVHKIFGQIENAIELVRSHKSVARGNLNIILPSGFASSICDYVLPQYIAKYPQVNLNIEVWEDLWKGLESNFDILIFPYIKGVELPDVNYVAKSLFTMPVGIYATHEYLEKHGEPKTPDDLLGHNCVAAFAGRWPFKCSQGQHYYMSVEGNLKVNDIDVVRSVVMNNLAIGYAYPQLFLNEIKNNKVKTILNDYLHLDVDVFVMYPPSHNIPFKTREFIRILSNYYREAASAS